MSDLSDIAFPDGPPQSVPEASSFWVLADRAPADDEARRMANLLCAYLAFAKHDVRLATEIEEIVEWVLDEYDLTSEAISPTTASEHGDDIRAMVAEIERLNVAAPTSAEPAGRSPKLSTAHDAATPPSAQSASVRNDPGRRVHRRFRELLHRTGIGSLVASHGTNSGLNAQTEGVLLDGRIHRPPFEI